MKKQTWPLQLTRDTLIPQKTDATCTSVFEWEGGRDENRWESSITSRFGQRKDLSIGVLCFNMRMFKRTKSVLLAKP